MKWQFLVLLSLAALAVGQDELKLAEPCDAEACQLPDCRCSSTAIPGGLAAKDTPQFVMITFDDGVNVLNIETYRDILYNRINTNGCKAGATFYVNHEYTNYQLVNELFNSGYEIALHSVSHQNNQQYWAEATYDEMKEEFVDQIDLVAHFANIPKDQLKGVRIPFLQLTGNSSFQVIGQSDLVYDCSWPTTTYLNPGLWPYTLDYASTQDCIIPPCPTASIPGAWVIPMISWVDLNGGFCSMVDSCFWLNVPPLTDEEGWFKFILGNFERHYLGNRAPFGFFIHEWYITANPAVKNAMVRFMDLINNLHDVFMVNSADVIDWVKDPIPIDQYISKQCNPTLPASCSPNSCGPLTAPHKDEQFWMQICGTCPNVYPWVGNPYGQ